jgi:hypothetical protein
MSILNNSPTYVRGGAGALDGGEDHHALVANVLVAASSCFLRVIASVVECSISLFLETAAFTSACLPILISSFTQKM